jgi:hypothetical protein
MLYNVNNVKFGAGKQISRTIKILFLTQLTYEDQ